MIPKLRASMLLHVKGMKSEWLFEGHYDWGHLRVGKGLFWVAFGLGNAWFVEVEWVNGVLVLALG